MILRLTGKRFSIEKRFLLLWLDVFKVITLFLIRPQLSSMMQGYGQGTNA